MQVVILCGGRGTRLGAETEIRPKPMVEIGGRPVVWHIMKHYATYGHTDFVLCLGYKGAHIKRYFLDYEATHCDSTVVLGAEPRVAVHGAHEESGWRVTLADTGLHTHTGARLKRIAPYLTDDRFFLTYGDGVSDIDLDALIAFHRRHGCVATVTAVHPPARFGELGLDAEGRVTMFSEKPQTRAGLINGGFFVFERSVLDYIPEGDDAALEHEPLVRLTEAKQLHAYRHEGFWQCMDTVRELTILRDFWDRGVAPWQTW